MEEEQKAVIIAGNIFDGHNLYGPFDSKEEAFIWAEENCKGDWLMAGLTRPNI